MRRFDNTKLWDFIHISDGSPAALSARLDEVLDEFLEELFKYCRGEQNIGERTRSLNYARTELTVFVETPANGTKKLAPVRCIMRRAMYFIGTELELIGQELEYPDRFIVFPEKHPLLARWGGNVNDLIEYFIGPQASGKLLNPDGRPMNYQESIGLLEKIFRIKISNPADRRGRVLDRQKNTSFQDEMRRVFLEEAKKRDK